MFFRWVWVQFSLFLPLSLLFSLSLSNCVVFVCVGKLWVQVGTRRGFPVGVGSLWVGSEG